MKFKYEENVVPYVTQANRGITLEAFNFFFYSHRHRPLNNISYCTFHFNFLYIFSLYRPIFNEKF